jgi:hypothetical protein
MAAGAARGSIEKNWLNNQKIDAAFSISLRALWG